MQALHKMFMLINYKEHWKVSWEWVKVLQPKDMTTQLREKIRQRLVLLKILMTLKVILEKRKFMMKFFIDIKNKKWSKKLKIQSIKKLLKLLLIYQNCRIKNQKNLKKTMTPNMRVEIQIQIQNKKNLTSKII